MPILVRLLPAALFFFSGCASLIFETLCSRKLGLVIGSTVQSASATVSAFLFGLGVGAKLGGWIVSRAKRPLLAFAALEATAGLGALAVLTFIPNLSHLLVPVARSAPAALLPAKVATVFLLLLLPACAMGASLPVLSHYYVENLKHRFMASLSFLYSVNTLGAATGVLVTDFFLVERLGVTKTGWVASVLYLLVAGMALLLGQDKRTEGEPKVSETPTTTSAGSTWTGTIALVASGFCGLTFQVLWTRMLVFFNGNDVFAFSTTLSVYLIGLVIGSAVCGRFGGAWKRVDTIMGGLLALLGLTAYLSLFTVDLVKNLQHSFQEHGMHDSMAVVFLSCGIVMLPSTICLGLLFPLAAQKLREADPLTGKAVGRAYLVNTFGSVLGALLAGYLLLPVLGLQKSLAWASGITIVLAFLILYRSLSRKAVAFVAPILFTLTLLATPQNFLLKTFYGELYQQIVFSSDDHYGSIALTRGFDPVLKEEIENLLVDGFNMAGNAATAVRYTTGLSALPILLHDDPKNGLIVCMGLGNTLNTALNLEPVEKIQCVELSREVPKALRLTKIGPSVLASPKLHLKFGDGRNFLLNTTENYDIISAEPPPPTHAGIVNLYSKEYYELCESRLKEEGIVCQWLPVFQMTPFEAKTIIKAFQEVFPYTYLWELGGEQLALIGKREPLDLDYQRFANAIAVNDAFLEGTGWNNPALVAALFIAGPEQLKEYTKDVPPLTDDWPRIQYSDKKWWVDQDFFFFNRDRQDLEWKATPKQKQEIDRARRAVVAFHLYGISDPRRAQMSTLERHDLGGLSLETFPNDAFLQTRFLATPARLQFFEEQSKLTPQDSRVHFEIARIHFLNGNLEDALKAIKSASSLPSDRQGFYQLYELLILFRMNRIEEVSQELSKLPENEDENLSYLRRLLKRKRASAQSRK